MTYLLCIVCFNFFLIGAENVYICRFLILAMIFVIYISYVLRKKFPKIYSGSNWNYSFLVALRIVVILYHPLVHW